MITTLAVYSSYGKTGFPPSCIYIAGQQSRNISIVSAQHTSVKMPLLIRPAVEADLERIVEILFEAFAPDPLTQIMFPHGGENPEAKNKALEQNRKDFHNPVITYMKIVDTDLNDEVIAFAKWYIYKKPLTLSLGSLRRSAGST